MAAELQRILLLEDEADIRSIATHALTALGGFKVLACASGQQALAQAESFQPQLLLFDVMLPELDGPATLEALRRLPSLQATPVIFMTTRTQPQDQLYYRQLGALGLIAKPFDALALPQQLRELWSDGRPQSTNAVDALSAHLRELTTHFSAQLPVRLQRLQQLVNTAATDMTALSEAVREAHGLAGAGGIFGFAQVSEYMAEVEAALLAIQSPNDLDQAMRQRLFGLMQRALATV